MTGSCGKQGHWEPVATFGAGKAKPAVLPSPVVVEAATPTPCPPQALVLGGDSLQAASDAVASMRLQRNAIAVFYFGLCVAVGFYRFRPGSRTAIPLLMVPAAVLTWMRRSNSYK